MNSSASRFALFLLVSLATVGSLQAREKPATSAHVTEAKVTLIDGTNDYELTWKTEPRNAPVTVSVSPDPDAEPSARQVIASSASGERFRWRAASAGRRHYFTIAPATGEPRKIALRVLPLEGGRNFRDLGGYETEDGKRVKWGHVYRSGVMAKLTDRDYDYLSDLGIKTVCDLRASDERDHEPTDWRGGSVEYVTFPDPEEREGDGDFLSVLREPDATPEQVSDAMAKGYVGIAKQHASSFRDMFDRLAAGEIPLAFNCSAGKDRTGTGAALLLSLLGVPRETVVADYALSEQVVDYAAEYTEASSDEGAPYAWLRSLPPELLKPLMRSDPRYIESSLAALEQEYGSIDTFIRTELDVTSQEASAIRAALLE